MARSRTGPSSGRRHYSVVNVESLRFDCRILATNDGKQFDRITPVAAFDAAHLLQEQDGRRLFEEIAHRIKDQADAAHVTRFSVALAMPGTIAEDTTVRRSTRLGILKPANCENCGH
jgi:hypothetical protein